MPRFLSMIFLLCSLLLTACNSINTKPSVANYDHELIRQTADQAYAAEDWQTAAENYQILTEHHEQTADTWYRLGNARAELGEMDQAIIALRKATEIEPEYIEAWHNLGIVYLRNATATFFEMQQYSPPDNPLATRGRFVINSVGQILKQGYGITVNRDQTQE